MSATYLHLPAGRAVPFLGDSLPFKAIVVVEQSVDAGWRDHISDWLVRAGCLYMMAWGRDCSAWDDSVDFASLSLSDFAEAPENEYVVTTWHEDETLSEVFWFNHHCARHPIVELTQTVILHIAPEARRAELLELWLTAMDSEPTQSGA